MADEANLSMLGDLTCSDPYAPSSGLHTQQGRIAGGCLVSQSVKFATERWWGTRAGGGIADRRSSTAKKRTEHLTRGVPVAGSLPSPHAGLLACPTRATIDRAANIPGVRMP